MRDGGGAQHIQIEGQSVFLLENMSSQLRFSSLERVILYIP